MKLIRKWSLRRIAITLVFIALVWCLLVMNIFILNSADDVADPDVLQVSLVLGEALKCIAYCYDNSSVCMRCSLC